ncbi:hypothetical protein OHS33_12135 [Streptomyces sp. NBC_00536]|uniref:hypothetical protein n=1 Tax=Streptomyces sp. NBC_00536 TaxID=2975769 RepID=UPI002E805DBA|nr:hypothetical protein [Streptomyces sp. NBC_00536]WUC79020.1 hypothetical protein OHS33_12135 [Streptomyces sp. NBC_00536]
MFDLLTGDELYAEMVMRRTNDDRSFLVVEGPADLAVFDRFVDKSRCLILTAHGKSRALNAIKAANDNSFPGALAILDRDWLGLLPLEEALDRISYTDDYDLDACVFYSESVCEGVASAFADLSVYEVGKNGCREVDIHDRCQSLAFPIGLLRFISARDSLALALRDFPISAAIDRATLKIDVSKIIKIALSKSDGSCPLTEDEILQIYFAEVEKVRHPRRYCSGHDLAKAFAYLLKSHWGASSNVGADIVERSSRAAMSLELLKRLDTHSNVERAAASLGVRVWKG